jgi:peptide deformylase
MKRIAIVELIQTGLEFQLPLTIMLNPELTILDPTPINVIESCFSAPNLV